MKIKVVQLNTWYGKQLDDMLAFFDEIKPDIFLLQEVTSGPEMRIDQGITNEYEILKNRYDLNSVYVPGLQYTDYDKKYHLGLSVMTRFGIDEVHSQYYQGRMLIANRQEAKYHFPGYLLSAKVNLEGRPLWCLTTHFTWSMHPEITDLQRESIANLKPMIEKYDEFILSGDFNVTDDSEIYQKLSEGLVDDRPEGIQNTLHPETHKIKGSKDLAVDYVFHKGDKIQKLHSEVPVIPVSDHLPVVAEYEIN